MIEIAPIVDKDSGRNRCSRKSIEEAMELFDFYRFRDKMDFDLLWCSDFLCLLALAKFNFNRKCSCGKEVELVHPSDEEMDSFVDGVLLPMLRRMKNVETKQPVGEMQSGS